MNYHLPIFIIMLSSLITCQSTDSSIQTDHEWKQYTSVQKMELISLSNYLYDNKLYDQAILSFFQYIYRYPGDSLEPLAYYYIGRCYEESSQPQIAIEYYEKIQTVDHNDVKLIQLAKYRHGISNILIGNDSEVYDLTEGKIDPYLLTLKGLVEFRAMKWYDARQSFLAAEASFNNTYYSKLLREMYEYMDHAIMLSGKKRWVTVLSSIFPGGGWVYLGDYNSAAGTFLGVTIPLIYTFSSGDLASTNIHYEYAYKTILPVNKGYSQNRILQKTINSNALSSIRYDMLSMSIGTYFGSIYATYSHVNEVNRNTVEEYIGTKINKTWLDDIFLNLEPEFNIY